MGEARGNIPEGDDEETLSIRKDLFGLKLKDGDAATFWEPKKLLQIIGKDETLAHMLYLGMRVIAKRDTTSLGDRAEKFAEDFEEASDAFMDGTTPPEYAQALVGMKRVLKEYGIDYSVNEIFGHAFDEEDAAISILSHLAEESPSFRKALAEFNKATTEEEGEEGTEEEEEKKARVLDTLIELDKKAQIRDKEVERRLQRAAEEAPSLREEFEKFDAAARIREEKDKNKS